MILRLVFLTLLTLVCTQPSVTNAQGTIMGTRLMRQLSLV